MNGTNTLPKVVLRQLHDGETVLQTASGYSTAWPALIGVSSGRVLVATDQRLLLFASKYWWPGLPTDLLSAHRYGPATLFGGGWCLRIGEERVTIQLHQIGRARRILELAALGAAGGISG